MDSKDKKRLYEEIIRQIAPVVKAHIEKLSDNRPDMFCKDHKRIVQTLDAAYKNFSRNIKELPKETARKICIDYMERYLTCEGIFPNTAVKSIFGNYRPGKHVNEVFNSEDEFSMGFSEIMNTLTRTFGMQEPYVELYDPFSHGTLAFVKQPIDGNLPDRYIISTIVPVINQNLKVITDFMDSNGYYLIRCRIGNDVVSYSDGSKIALMANMCFARKVPVDISSFVRQKPYIFHVTPYNKLAGIQKSGLVPTTRISEINIMNQDIHYPARTYFFLGDDSKKAIDYAKYDMPKGKYVLLRVDTDRLPDGLPVYLDPLLNGMAIYVEYTIPPEDINIIS